MSKSLEDLREQYGKLGDEIVKLESEKEKELTFADLEVGEHFYHTCFLSDYANNIVSIKVSDTHECYYGAYLGSYRYESHGTWRTVRRAHV